MVRLAATAVRAGYTALLYERPIELTGQGVSSDEWTSTGLLELEVVAGIDLAVLPLKPRPAYGVWRWLQSTFSDVNASDFTTLHDTPQGVEGMVLPSGWLVWFDWFAGAAPGADYAGEERPVILTGLTSRSLRVLTLWPESVCMQLGDEGECEVTWTETYLPVVDETAQVIVGQDPVWVEASDVVVAPEGETEEAPEPTEADASSEDDVTVDPTDDVEAPTEGPVDEGGCNSSRPSQGWLGLVALLAAWAVRRCSSLRVRAH